MPADLLHTSPEEYIKSHIRTVPDWPKPGIQFRDITPLLVTAVKDVEHSHVPVLADHLEHELRHR